MVVLTEGFLAYVRLIDSILEEMQSSGTLRPGLTPQVVRSAMMGMIEGLLRDRFLAERLGYPANFDTQKIGEMLALMLSSIVNPPCSAEAA